MSFTYSVVGHLPVQRTAVHLRAWDTRIGKLFFEEFQLPFLFVGQAFAVVLCICDAAIQVRRFILGEQPVCQADLSG